MSADGITFTADCVNAVTVIAFTVDGEENMGDRFVVDGRVVIDKTDPIVDRVTVDKGFTSDVDGVIIDSPIDDPMLSMGLLSTSWLEIVILKIFSSCDYVDLPCFVRVCKHPLVECPCLERRGGYKHCPN